MQYRPFGNTGFNISTLGFGAMRLPTIEKNNIKRVDSEKAINVIRYAFTLGINYIDSAYFYHDGESEITVGEAVKGWRDKVRISTKSPGHLLQKPGDYRRILEEQLHRLKEDYIDFYHFHGIGYHNFRETDKKTGWSREAIRAKEEGLIKHISFSFHAEPEELIKLVDTGLFSSLLCQYNFLDRSNENAIAYAQSKGLGVAVMGPVGGGRIAGLPEKFRQELHLPAINNIELAFRFVLANLNVNCALSGMNSISMVEENVQYASDSSPLKEKEIEDLNLLVEKYRKLADLYCTDCKYCMPCPQGIDIPFIFDLYNYYRVYELTEHAKQNYNAMGKEQWLPKIKADACIDCGLCESRCPQKIAIRAQLKDAHQRLTNG